MIVLAAPARAQSVNAVPDTGSADAGVASRAIVNVAANDTVNGAAAILGTAGNAKVAQVGTWPSGTVLNPSTGAVSTSTALAAGTYSMQYKLCDNNTPANCAAATDTLNVINASIVPNTDGGTADAGIASRPIANVAANDTVNGAAAILGSLGNATVAQVGTWPSGIALTPSTGAVSTTVAASPGIYSVQYSLCDRNLPPTCVTATDNVNIITASIVANADSGTADAGIASRPITNVAANDMVNGGTVTLGTAGNATVGQVGTWPTGIALTPSTGAVSTTVGVPAGLYSIQYQLCDRNVPASCATVADSVSVIAASIVANADSGSANLGVSSRPIANVTANDSVNGAAVTLGASGNGTVAQVGTWPTGIALTPSTGAVSTTVAVPTGVYSIQYYLCDKNTPAKCVSATDTVTVINASIIPNPDSGIGTAGIASTPIANVTANDTVNGAAVALGTGGNATIAQVGSWPNGISLAPGTGAVSMTAAVTAGIYGVQYRLCDKSVPASCATTTDSVSVSFAPSIVANPENGSAVAGTASTPIANVVANDSVNGAAAVLGGSGIASISQVGSWPTGITLNTATGAISTSTASVAGSFQLPYQLCSVGGSVSCATATDTVTVASAFAEVQVSTVSFNDIEFDWGRDGVYCAACNFGQGNARFNWTDTNGNLWVGHLDPATGAFTPQEGNNELADTSAFYYAAFGNGPEWAFSTQNSQVVSQLVYTRYIPGGTATSANAGAAFATPVAGGWTASFFPGAIGVTAGGGVINTVNPSASQCLADSVALTEFNDLANPQGVYWEPTLSTAGTMPTLMPFGAYATTISGGKPAIRSIPCTRNLVFVGAAPPDVSGNVYQQVFWYNIDSQIVQQLTVEAHNHSEAFMFQAPEFGDSFVLLTISDNLNIEIYKQTGTGSNGAPTLQLVNQIASPDPAEQYIIGTEPFIHCNPACQSYVILKLESTVSTRNNLATVPNGVAVTNIDPANSIFKILVPQGATPTIQRMDLEYYITANGPYLYYDRNVISSGTTQFKPLGRFYVDMQLGPPSGACAGSSAEGGMAPGC